MLRSGSHFQHRYGASHLKTHLQKDGVFKERYNLSFLNIRISIWFVYSTVQSVKSNNLLHQ